MKNERKDLRVKEKKSLAWSLEDGDLRGKGSLKNISVTGMLVEATSSLDPFHDSLLSFDADLGAANFIPKKGRLVWSKKQSFSNHKYLWGIQFDSPSEYILSRLHNYLQANVKKLVSKEYLTGVLRVVLFLVSVAMICFIVWTAGEIYQKMTATQGQMAHTVDSQIGLTQKYSSLYEQSQHELNIVSQELASAKILYSESEEILLSVNAELNATKVLLAETETMLSESNNANVILKEKIASLSESKQQEIAQAKVASQKIQDELNSTIILLQQKNDQLGSEMSSIQEKLAYYEGHISNMEEGRALIGLYRQRLKSVKKKMKHYQREAKNARMEALKDRDRMRMIFGNNGYLIKEGSSVKVNLKKFNAPELLKKEIAPVSAPKKVSINVEIID